MIKYLFVFIITAIIFLLLLFTFKKVRKIACDINNRPFQFGCIPLVILYVLMICFFLEPLNHIIYAIVSWILLKLPILQVLSSLLTIVVTLCLNVVIVLLYNFVKGFMLSPLVHLWRDSKISDLLQEYTISYFYDYDENKNKWYLNRFSMTMNTLISYMTIAFCICAFIYFALAIVFIHVPFFQIPYYPVLTLLVLIEIIDFFAGLKREIKAGTSIDGENDNVEADYNFMKLRIALAKTFTQNLLFHDQKMKGLDSRNDSREYLEKLCVSDIYEEKLVGMYFLGLDKEKGHIDSQYVKATLDIMNNKSIIFSTPFYKDLTSYIFFALNRSILSKEKVLIIVGRDSIVDDVCQWANETLDEVAKNPYLWEVAVLDDRIATCDVGLLSISQLYDLNIHINNKEFFEQVHRVVLLEPSRIIATAQPALYMLARRLPSDCQFSIFDKNSNGLVDALSHILKTNLTEVNATKFGALSTQYMIWNADAKNMHEKIFPSISKYLGIGSELAVLSLRQGISKVDWVSYDAFPIVDMKWLLGLYHSKICDFARIPSQQHRINEYLSFVPNIWGTKKRLDACVIVEDEYNNMFEMIRQFSTRGEQQAFVNVISSNYMLKDYMQYHANIFVDDAKAIPNFTADHVRTSRNVIMELLMRLAIAPMSESEIQVQLDTASFEEAQLDMNIQKDDDAITILKKGIRKFIIKEDDIDLEKLIKEKQKRIFSDELMDHINICEYYIDDAGFINRYLTDFKNAKYIAEDESNPVVLGATLYGLVHQKYLPKQFVTMNGKYFEIVSIEKNAGVRLRRASDHIHGRLFYRQMKQFVLENSTNDVSSSPYRFNGITIKTMLKNITVKTDGYFELTSHNDLAHAKEVVLSNIDDRNYREKRVLNIQFTNMVSSVKVTLAALLNELFKTTYPDNYEYINVACMMNEEQASSLKGIVSRLSGDVDDDSIYIIEDSQLDLGMLVSIERNINKFLEIVCDYLTWYLEEEVIPVEVTTDDDGNVSEIKPVDNPKKLSILQKLRKLFKGRKAHAMFDLEIKDEDGNVIHEEDESTDQINGGVSDDGVVETNTTQESNDDVVIDEVEETSDEVVIDEVDETNDEVDTDEVDETNDDVQITKGGTQIQFVVKHHSDYLNFGHESLLSALDLEMTHQFLSELGFSENSLKQARENLRKASREEEQVDLSNARRCDFCGRMIEEYDDYDMLEDSRIRCVPCRSSAVRTLEEFKTIFELTKQNYEALFNVKITSELKLEMLSSKKLHEKLGQKYDPHGGRVLGVAIRGRDGKYTIYIENGAPRNAFVATLVHEMTHIWQYENWKEDHIERLYGPENTLAVYEGMAKWVEIQYLYLIGEHLQAKRSEYITFKREDAYGKGFRAYYVKYRFSKTSMITTKTPFENHNQPV